jgi:hypothetical protein
MSNETTAMRQNRWWTNLAVCAVLLTVAAGCNCITINVGQPPPAGFVQTPTVVRPGRPAGGNFVPVQAQPTTGGQLTVCTYPVSGTYVRFYPPAQSPNPGDTGFRGNLWNLTTGLQIPNTAYYLEWWVTVANKGCCTNVPNSNDVGCPVTPGLSYRFIAHFKSPAPPTSDQIRLQGAWTH